MAHHGPSEQRSRRLGVELGLKGARAARGSRASSGAPTRPLEVSSGPPPWPTVDRVQLAGTMLRLPERDEVEVPFDERQVIEFHAQCGSDDARDRLRIPCVMSSGAP